MHSKNNKIATKPNENFMEMTEKEYDWRYHVTEIWQELTQVAIVSQ